MCAPPPGRRGQRGQRGRVRFKAKAVPGQARPVMSVTPGSPGADPTGRPAPAGGLRKSVDAKCQTLKPRLGGTPCLSGRFSVRILPVARPAGYRSEPEGLGYGGGPTADYVHGVAFS